MNVPMNADPNLVSYFSGLSIPELNREMEMVMMQLQDDPDIQALIQVINSHPEIAQAASLGNQGRSAMTPKM